MDAISNNIRVISTIRFIRVLFVVFFVELQKEPNILGFAPGLEPKIRNYEQYAS